MLDKADCDTLFNCSEVVCVLCNFVRLWPGAQSIVRTGHGALILVVSRNIQVSYFYIFHVVLSVLFKLSTCQICMRSVRVSQIF